MKRLKIPICLGVLFLAVLTQCNYVQANISEPFTFINLPKNTNTANGDIGEDQLYVVVSDCVFDYASFYDAPDIESWEPVEGTSLNTDPDDPDLIMFTFYNIGDDYCSIVDIYFYDGTIVKDTLGIYDSSDGVAYTPGAVPINLPGTEYAKLIEGYTLDGSADSDECQIIENGIESIEYVHDDSIIPQDEWISIVFELQENMTFLDVCDAIDNGTLLIGLRVHFDPDNFGAPDGEEQFLTCFTPVPAPGAVMLGGMGIAFVGWLRRRRTL